MVENLVFSVQGLFDEVVEQGVAQGVADKEAYDELVDEVIEAHLAVGELDIDQNVQGYASDVKARWPEYEKAFAMGE